MPDTFSAENEVAGYICTEDNRKNFMQWQLPRVFIRRIEVYEKTEKYSSTCENPIVIHYAFQLPEQNGMPAIEVLARPTAMTA